MSDEPNKVKNMDKEQAFQMIEEAKVRLLTDEEVSSLDAWAKEVAAAQPQYVEGTPHALIDWITTYTTSTRASEHFSANFKKINQTVLNHVVAVFNPSGNAKARAEKEMEDERQWYERRQAKRDSKS